MIKSLYVSSLFAGVLEDILTSLYKEGVWKVDKISNLVLNLAYPSHSSLPTEARSHAYERKMKSRLEGNGEGSFVWVLCYSTILIVDCFSN